MYARVPTFKVTADKLDASIDHFKAGSLPALQKLPGFKGATLLADRERGLLRVIAYWEDRAALDASFEPTKGIRGEYADKFGAELASLEVFEVALQV
jgi:heme-degrading monooxygenase HmoA